MVCAAKLTDHFLRLFSDEVCVYPIGPGEEGRVCFGASLSLVEFSLLSILTVSKKNQTSEL